MEVKTVLSCLLKFRDNNTKEGAIDFLKCLKEYEVIVYWSDTWQRLIMRPKVGDIFLSKGLLRKETMEKVREKSGIENKKDWDEVKQRYNL